MAIVRFISTLITQKHYKHTYRFESTTNPSKFDVILVSHRYA